MLDALAKVLRQIPGVRFVDRQDIDPTSMVASSQLPAIVIDEQSSEYEWLNRHGDRSLRVNSQIILDLQANAATASKGPGYSVSTVRELFTARVIFELVNESTLTVQLDSEDEPTKHANDSANGFSVRYPDAGGNDVRSLITTNIQTCETFDDREPAEFDTIIADIYEYDDEGQYIPDFQASTEDS